MSVVAQYNKNIQSIISKVATIEDMKIVNNNFSNIRELTLKFLYWEEEEELDEKLAIICFNNKNLRFLSIENGNCMGLFFLRSSLKEI